MRGVLPCQRGHGLRFGSTTDRSRDYRRLAEFASSSVQHSLDRLETGRDGSGPSPLGHLRWPAVGPSAPTDGGESWYRRELSLPLSNARGSMTDEYSPELACYRCGRTDHVRRNCPGAMDLPPAAIPGSARAAVRSDDKPVPWFPPVEPEVAIGAAQSIREQMGWPEPGIEKTCRKQRMTAAEQVTASRAERLAALDSVNEVVNEPASRT